jgi:hypothetical protein
VIANSGGVVFGPDAQLTPKQRRALIRRALLRPALTAGLLLLMYSVVPLTNYDKRRDWILLVVVLVAFGLVVYWQINRILDSDRPVLQGLEALAAAMPIYLLGFSALYFEMAAGDPELFSEPLSRTAAVYFTVTVFATVGFGDITPTTDLSRAIVTGQIMCNLFVIGLGGRVLYGVVRHGLDRKNARTSD